MNWIEERSAKLATAIAELKARCILASIRERRAAIRSYHVSGRYASFLAEDVIALAEQVKDKEALRARRDARAEVAA